MNIEVKSDFLQDLCFATFFWSLLIYIGGYEVGIGDQEEFLPYALYLHDKTLYPFDLYIQGMEAMIINERYFFAHALSFLVPVLEPSIIFLHFLFTIILITGMLKFAAHFVENRFLQYLVVFMVLIVTMGLNTGGNEIYYNNFQGSTIAKGLCMWGLVFLVERNYVWILLITIVATLFQPFVGLHFFLLSTATLAYSTFISKEEKISSLIKFIIAFAGTSGIYVMAIKYAQGQEILAHLSNKEFINISYYFSMPHHFIPSYFNKKGIILSIPLILISIYFYAKKSKNILIFLLTILLGIIIYLIGTYVVESSLIISSWWFRTTVWIKIIGFVALAGILESYLKIHAYDNNKNLEKFLFLTTTIVLLSWIILFPQTISLNNRYHFFNNALKDADVEICNQIKTKVPKNAVFIQPALFTALKYYGEKSSYVEFLTRARRKDYSKIWYERIKEVYNVRYEDIPRNNIIVKSTQIRSDLIKKLDRNFKMHTKESLTKLKKHGVTHILTFKDHNINGLEIIAENNLFKIYKL